MATTMTQEQPSEWLQLTQEQRNERLQRAWNAQGEGHVLPRRSPKDRDDMPMLRRSGRTEGWRRSRSVNRRPSGVARVSGPTPRRPRG
jgi:hypothetical protein